MGALKALFLASAAVVGLASLAHAADLLPPAPQMEPPPPPMAAAEFTGWYLRGDVGVGVASGNPGVGISPNPLVGLPSDAYNSFYNASLSASALFDVGVGYQINNWLRFDVTGEYRGGSHFQVLEQVGIPSIPAQYGDFYRGDAASLIGLVNDLGTWWGVTPFLGAGVGVANNRLSGVTDQGFACNGFCSPSGGYLANGSNTSLAWALMAGLDFNVTENLKLELGYRFLDYGKLKTGGSNCFNGTGVNGGFSAAFCGGSSYSLATRDLYSQDFRLGLRWDFAEGPTFSPEPGPLVRKY
jgi:opacity protein-like surface antigen